MTKQAQKTATIEADTTPVKPDNFSHSVYYLIDEYATVSLGPQANDDEAMAEAQKYVDQWDRRSARVVRTDQYNVGEIDGKSIQSGTGTIQRGLSA